MALFEWSDQYKIGIPSVDKQHERLVASINVLHDFIQAGNKNPGVLNPVFKELVEYAKDHFTYEENLFRNLGYPLAEEHITEHGRFVDLLEQFQKKYLSGEAVGESLLTFLKNWLVGHILTTDTKYVPFFKEHNVD